MVTEDQQDAWAGVTLVARCAALRGGGYAVLRLMLH